MDARGQADVRTTFARDVFVMDDDPAYERAYARGDATTSLSDVSPSATHIEAHGKLALATQLPRKRTVTQSS